MCWEKPRCYSGHACIYSCAPLTRFSRPPIVSLASPRRSGSPSPRCLSLKSDSGRVQSSALRSSPSHSRHTCNFPGRSTGHSTVPLPPMRDSLCRSRNGTASAVDASYLFTAVAATNLKARARRMVQHRHRLRPSGTPRVYRFRTASSLDTATRSCCAFAPERLSRSTRLASGRSPCACFALASGGSPRFCALPAVG